MGRFVDLSHPLEEGMPVYPGLPAPRFSAIVDHEGSRERYEDKAEFYLSSFEGPCNLGTYIDSPFHRFREGKDLNDLELATLVGLEAVVLDANVGEDRVARLDVDDVSGKAVLVRSGWDGRWGTESYWEPGPFLGADAVTALIERGAALVGVDFWNVDDTLDPSRPAHTRLLEAGIPIVEHMCNLGALPGRGFRFFAPVVRIVRGASFPVRAFAEVLD